MNEDVLNGKWKNVKGEAKKKWGKLTNNNTMVISGKKEKLVGSLQTKYGHTKSNVKNRYRAFIDRKK